MVAAVPSPAAHARNAYTDDLVQITRQAKKKKLDCAVGLITNCMLEKMDAWIAVAGRTIRYATDSSLWSLEAESV